MKDKDVQLTNAIKQSNTTELRNLLLGGADANTNDENGIPALGLAMASQNIENVKLLLRHGANANFKTHTGDTALFIAVHMGNVENVQALLDGGADINYANPKGVTALQKAALKGYANVVKLLLERGADVDARQDSGATALIISTAKGHADVVKILLDAGADPNLKDNGLAALDFATNSGYTKIADMLRDKMGQKGGCFIATAVYDSPKTPEIETLRQFRDTVLLNSKIGQLLVTVYYRISPPLARTIAESQMLKRVIRSCLLAPVIKLIRKMN